MIALCPEHHDKADEGVITRKDLYQAKKEPYSRTIVKESDFRIPGTVASVKLGTNTFINTPRIVVIDGLEMVSAVYDAGRRLLNVVMIDEHNNWVGIVDENEWVFDRRAVWDIDYHPRKLTIRSKPRKIAFEMAIGDDAISFRGELYYNGVPILVSEDKARFGGQSALTMSNVILKDFGTAVNLSTFPQVKLSRMQMLKMLAEIRRS